ncbi:head decoration protein [Paeniglutamicibacter terrestris]|uniref:Head decoration protein n=1 Tax=Paeniglutamicibacter terrestris TaxID=2723403 RepID=A0ABX1G4C9_9MICC|nr:head decoration protein [Paeniglutamicibacter terrestris]NKG21102.1 head decoration protein [Paeniglutamicibacter terrestris]
MDIGVTQNARQVENLSWRHQDGGYDAESITLDISAFTAGTHYPNGYVRSGTPLGKITATGLFGPYDNAASDGREVCAGVLAAFTPVPAGGRDAGAALFFAGVIKASKLPITIDTAGKADLAAWIRFV